MFLVYLGIYILFGVGYVVPRTEWGVDETWKQALWGGFKVGVTIFGWVLVACAEFIGLIRFTKGENDNHDDY